MLRIRQGGGHVTGGGVFVWTLKHLGEGDRKQLTVEAMSTEVLTTSEIEGEILGRASVQSLHHCARKFRETLTHIPTATQVLISVVETNDLSRRHVFHTHIVQVANVLGGDAVVAKFGDFRDGESIW
jgi:hypothetical protein